MVPEFNRVLVVKPSSLGDIVHAFPAVELLRRHLPAVVIDWVADPRFADIIDFQPGIGRVVSFDRRGLGNPFNFPAAGLRFLRQIRRHKYDLVVDFQGLMRSAAIARSARSKLRCGFAKPREAPARWAYHREITVADDVIHAVDRNIVLMAGALGVEREYIVPPMPVVERHRHEASRVLAESGAGVSSPLVAVMPGARWPTKTWSPEFFIRVIEDAAAASSSLRFVLLGSPAERQATAAINKAVSGLSYDLGGVTSIGGLVEIIRMCSAALTNDSGPMHIAAALGKPAIAMFGPTDPEKTGPYGGGHRVFQPPLDCIKCFKRYCPKAGGGICQDAIGPRLVAEALVDAVKNGKKTDGCQAI